MGANIKILDINNNEIDLSTGIDLGISRKGISNVTKFKIKNIGDMTARDLIISATTLNNQNEVTNVEYKNQLKAVNWKSFSLDEKGEFLRELRVGDLKPNKFVEGTKSTIVDFTTAEKCILKEVWNTGITEYKLGTQIFKKTNNEVLGQIAKRMYFGSLLSCREFDIDFNVFFDTTTENQSSTVPFLACPVRINSKGDSRGYMFMFQYRRTDNKFMISIYKDAKGMTTNIDRDYGTKIFDTITWTTFDKNKKVGFKIYNNSFNQPTFEVKYNEQNMKLGKASDSNVNGFIMSDIASNSYIEEGQFYIDISMYDGDKSCTISNMTLKTEELEQPIFMKTYIGDDAEDKIEYRSSVVVSYIQD